MQDRRFVRRSGFGALCFLGGLVATAAGCDGGASSGRAGTDGGATDGGATDGGGKFPKVDAKGGSPTDAKVAQAVEEPISPMLKKLPFTGKVALVGTGISSCTNQEPAPGDRWCAVSRSAELGREELWVINISAFSAGTAVQCTGNDPNCIRLTPNLWTGTPSVGPTHPYAHAFDGDTLIFHADATSAATDLYQGPIYAWRPGWAKPRRISSPKGITCAAHFQGLAALCLDNIEPDETKPLEFDLLAGPLPTGADMPLPRIDRIHPSRSNDVSKWRASFSRDASQFCYSTGRTPTDAENLWCFATANLAANAVATGTRNTAPLVNDAAKWQFSRDTQKLYYLKNYNYSNVGNPEGALTMVDYPTAANPVTISSNVGGFLLLSDGTDADKGLGIFADVAQNHGTLRLLRDRSAPADFVTVAVNAVGSSIYISPDLRYTYFSQNVNESTNLADAWVTRNGEATKVNAPIPCALQRNSSTDLYGSPFLDKSGLVFWVDDVDPNVLVGKGMVANPADCSNKQQYAKDIDFWFTVNDEGLIYSDDTNNDVISLRYVKIPDGKTWPTGGAGLPLQKQAGRIYSMTLPAYDLLVVQMDQGYASDGVYYAKLPFGAPPSAPDAGVTDAAVDSM